MLKNTFCHIPGIGRTTEERLWSRGFPSWDEVVAGSGSLPLSRKRSDLVANAAAESAAALARADADYFYPRLPSSQQWRMFPEFRCATAYLDIETTGLGAPGDYITTIALYDGDSIRHFVQNDNLFLFPEVIERYQLIVTYNGKSFDAPFIRHHLGVPMRQAHIDLRHVLASLGYRGGLKGCERQLGIDRKEMADIDGYFAVLLWFDYLRNRNERALETLLAYNTLDAVNLELLMVFAYNEKIKGTPFAESHRLAAPASPDLPFRPDAETIARLKGRAWGGRGEVEAGPESS
ncbi:MAG TPA: ribonuclease H-like domain-containing protein [Sumerlaeia bacterium]|nr:ribonuclease H-like domain-containing protein [Sumerlaeia bacterium]